MPQSFYCWMLNSEYHVMKQIILSCHLIDENTQEKKGQVSLPSFQRIQYVDRICNFLQAISHQTAIFSELTISQNFHTDLFKLYMLSIYLRFLKPHEQNHVESSEFNQIQI